MTFAGQTAVTACLAFVVAWLLGLEHPQWAAMTVWAASQPTRGQLLEKSFFRFAGTVIGTIAGVLLVMAMTIHPMLLVLGLALWVGGCTFLGNLQRGIVAYGTVLAGYTAAMVALLDAAHPQNVLHLGADRLATVLTGVLAAGLIGYLLARPLPSELLRQRVEALLADLMEWLARPAGDADPDADRMLLSELAAIEEGLDPHAAGSIRSHREVHEVRGVLIAAVPLLLWRRDGVGTLGDASAAKLAAVAEHFRADDLPAAIAALVSATEETRPEAALRAELANLSAALAQWRQSAGKEVAPSERPLRLRVVLHRDWAGAREAMVRATGSLLFFGAIWLVTGWSAAVFMLLGLSVMLSLFSTMENPARLMRSVFLGQVYGLIGALICRWLVWPLATSELQVVLFTLPFILLGPFLVSHHRTRAASFDYNMVMLLLLQPHFPLAGSFGASLAAGLAVIAAPLAAMAAYNYVYPPTLRRRQDVLMAAMLHDLADLASDATALSRRPIWQARLYHRTLRLVRLSERSERANVEALDAGLAFLNLGHAAMRCHELLEGANRSESDRRALRNTLTRMQQVKMPLAQTKRALDKLGRRFSDDDAAIFHNAGSGIGTLDSFLHRPAV